MICSLVIEMDVVSPMCQHLPITVMVQLSPACVSRSDVDNGYDTTQQFTLNSIMPFVRKNKLVQGCTTLQLSLSSVPFVARETFSMLPEEILNGVSLYTNLTILCLRSTAGGGMGLMNRINLTCIGICLKKSIISN